MILVIVIIIVIIILNIYIYIYIYIYIHTACGISQGCFLRRLQRRLHDEEGQGKAMTEEVNQQGMIRLSGHCHMQSRRTQCSYDTIGAKRNQITYKHTGVNSGVGEEK